MSKLNPPPRRDPPRYVDLTEREVAHLQLRKQGFANVNLTAASMDQVKMVLYAHDLQLDRSTVLLRSFRNV